MRMIVFLFMAGSLIIAFAGCAGSARSPQALKEIKEKPRPLSGKRELPATRAYLRARRVLIISVDGLRPDLLLRAKAPHIQGLMNRGSYSLWAHTTDVAITLPSHVSMLTGVTPPRHGIHFNKDIPASQMVYPNAPTLFELAKEAGYTTGIATSKSKFDPIARPGVVDWVEIPDPKGGSAIADALTAKAASNLIRQHKPQVMFTHFADVDRAGHKHGWSSPEQLKAIASADAAVGQVLAALKDANVANSTVIILSSDHGGSGSGHGAGDERSKFIPWIAAGPGIRKNYDLTSHRSLTIRTYDTFATACFILGLPYDTAIDGKPIYAIIDQKELMYDVPPTTPPKTAASN